MQPSRPLSSQALATPYPGPAARAKPPGRRAPAFAGLALALLASGCGRHAPKGQVVATVGKQEITRQDLEAEARAGGPADAQILTQRVVARTLLAQDAHRRGVERDAAYPADLTRLKEQFLAQRGLRTIVQPPRLTPAQGQAFIAAHPLMFARRQRISVDEVRFPSTRAQEIVSSATTLDGVVEKLKQLNIQYDRASRALDTATLPPPLAQALLDAPAGKLLSFPSPQATVVLVVQGREPVTVAPDQQAVLARQAMAQQIIAQQVSAQVEKLRRQTKIEYQKGFAPPAGTAAAPASAAAPAAPAEGAENTGG
jgi:peptidyl-prolyl cis-trans isomerase C